MIRLINILTLMYNEGVILQNHGIKLKMNALTLLTGNMRNL